MKKQKFRILRSSPFILSAICTLLCLLCSCQPSSQGPAGEKGIPVVVADGSQFPKSLSGVWQQEGTIAREFVISPDGRITSAVIGLGMVRVSPTEETRVPLIAKGEGTLVPGKWAASYDSATRELQISLEMKSVQFQAGKQAIEGIIRESFNGRVSDDGMRWEVHYFALSEYHAYTDTGKHAVLSDGTEPEEQDLIFNRIVTPAK
jgi:hypothetical protein